MECVIFWSIFMGSGIIFFKKGLAISVCLLYNNIRRKKEAAMINRAIAKR